MIVGILLNLLAVYFSPAEAATASPSGTTIPSAPQIIADAGDVWTRSSGIFYENGIARTSALTILLLYYNGTIYANNSDGNWYSWNKGWRSVPGDPRGVSSNSVSPDSVSPSGTTIPIAPQIVDSAGDVWTRSGGIFYENGIAKTSSLTILLLYYNDTIYANNSDGYWYSWNNGWMSVPGDPRGGSSNSVSSNSISPSGTTIPSAPQIVDGAANVWMRSGGIFYENGIARTSSLTILLLYYSGTIYANNSDGSWYSWNNGWRSVPGDPRGASSNSVSAGGSSLPPLPAWTTGAIAAAGSAAGNITVMQASQPLQTAPPRATINIGANFTAVSPLSEAATLNIHLVDAGGNTRAQVQNDLANNFTGLPATEWSGPLSIVTSMTVPSIADGTYYVMLGLNNATGPIQLTPGPGVAQDNKTRYYVGAVTVQASAPPPTPLGPVTLDLTGHALTFNEEFTSLTISDSTAYDGAKWYTHNQQCCMVTTDGTTTAMVGLSSPQNPFSLISGGGLRIRLQKTNNHWTSGVLTSVDNSGIGFSQQYGYFEIEAAFPSGFDTWPAFWMLNTAAKARGAPAGEIDIVEYIANPGFIDYIRTTLHDWGNNTAPAWSANRVSLPSDGNYHTYGLLWTAETMTFYYDRTVTFQAPTPAIMHQPYYMIVDLGIGAGWPTEATPPVNDMLVRHIRAYSLPAQYEVHRAPLGTGALPDRPPVGSAPSTEAPRSPFTQGSPRLVWRECKSQDDPKLFPHVWLDQHRNRIASRSSQAISMCRGYERMPKPLPGSRARYGGA